MKTIKKISIITLLLLSMAFVLEAKTITINSMPNTVEDFLKLRNQIAKTPEGGAAIFIVAMMKYSEDVKMGSKFFTIALARRNISRGRGSDESLYKGFKPARHLNYHLRRFRKKTAAHWPFLYVQGAKPSNGYATSTPYTFNMSRNKYSGKESSGKVKVFVECYGVRPRPMKLVKNNRGYWKALNVSSFWMGSVRPAQNIDDDL